MKETLAETLDTQHEVIQLQAQVISSLATIVLEYMTTDELGDTGILDDIEQIQRMTEELEG